MSNCAIIITTTDNIEIAIKISRILVEEGHAKCVQRDNIESIYEWGGNIETSTEYRIMIKCLRSRIEDITKIIKEEHNYKVPEMIYINIDGGDKDYMQWITK